MLPIGTIIELVPGNKPIVAPSTEGWAETQIIDGHVRGKTPIEPIRIKAYSYEYDGIGAHYVIETAAGYTAKVLPKYVRRYSESTQQRWIDWMYPDFTKVQLESQLNRMRRTGWWPLEG